MYRFLIGLSVGSLILGICNRLRRFVVYGVPSVILVLTVATPCQSAPATFTTLAPSKYWWDTCASEPTNRHSRGTSGSPVATMLNISASYLEHNINPFYTSILKVKNKQIRHQPWLQKMGFFKKLRRDNPESLIKIHKEVQIYGATIYRLFNMQLTTASTFDEPGRRDLLCHTIRNSKSLLTEIEDTSHNYQFEVVKEGYITAKEVPTSMDFTQGIVMEYGILTSYKKFLRMTYRKLFGKRGKGGRRRNKNQFKKKTTAKNARTKLNKTTPKSTKNKRRNLPKKS